MRGIRVVAQFDLAAVRCAGRSLVPLVKTRAFGMTPRAVIMEFKLSHYGNSSRASHGPETPVAIVSC
jgi:hypothetical protein